MLRWPIGMSLARQPGQPLSGVGDVGQAGVGVLPDREEGLYWVFAYVRPYSSEAEPLK